MNIGMMTTWNQHCGVFGYTQQLVEKLIWLNYGVKIFSNYFYRNESNWVPGFVEIVPPTFLGSVSCFGTGHHKIEEQKMNMEVICKEVIENKIDILHIQYQDYLYPDKENFNRLLSWLKQGGIKLVVTQHDSCISPNIDWGKFDIIIRHGPEYKREGKNVIMPIGIPEIEYKPLPRNRVLSSFGMGRNDNETCQKVCDKLGWTFRFHNSQDKWLPIKDLMAWLQEGDAIALIYPPVGAEVSSSALRIALGTGRPVIVSDTNWFKDSEEVGDMLFRITWDNRLKELEERLFLLPNCEHTSEYLTVNKRGEEDLKKIQEKYGWSKTIKYYEEIYGD